MDNQPEVNIDNSLPQDIPKPSFRITWPIILGILIILFTLGISGLFLQQYLSKTKQEVATQVSISPTIPQPTLSSTPIYYPSITASLTPLLSLTKDWKSYCKDRNILWVHTDKDETVVTFLRKIPNSNYEIIFETKTGEVVSCPIVTPPYSSNDCVKYANLDLYKDICVEPNQCTNDRMCPEGYFCNYGIATNLPNPTTGIAEVIGESGSKQCIKSCESNADCKTNSACIEYNLYDRDAIWRKKGCK